MLVNKIELQPPTLHQKIELTIKPDYVPNWTFKDAIRELLSNAKDAAEQNNTDFYVWNAENKLCIRNSGTLIPEDLLLGQTSKRNNSNLIGTHGEGLKTGLIVLAREGYKVRIFTGDEIWIPRIERSEKFNADVLTFSIYKTLVKENRVQIEIEGVSSETWLELKNNFLFLEPPHESHKTQDGEILIEEKYEGCVYVKGVLVEKGKTFYGYNLNNAILDRDRRLVLKSDLPLRLRSIWFDALRKNPGLYDSFYGLLLSGQEDVAGLDEWNVLAFPKPALTYMSSLFKKEYGEESFPVTSYEQAKDISHFGKIGVVVPKPAVSILSLEFGSVQDLKKSMAEEVNKTYKWTELSKEEFRNICAAKNILSYAIYVPWEDIYPVEFRASNLEGRCEKNKILISKYVLKDLYHTLAVLVHEAAHLTGYPDGDKLHIATVEKYWTAIAQHLHEDLTKNQ